MRVSNLKVAKRPKAGSGDEPRARVPEHRPRVPSASPKRRPTQKPPAVVVTFEDAVEYEAAERRYVERCFIQREHAHGRATIVIDERAARAAIQTHLNAAVAARELSSLHAHDLAKIAAECDPSAAFVRDREIELRGQLSSLERQIAMLTRLRAEIQEREESRAKSAALHAARVRADRDALDSRMAALEAEEARLRALSLDGYLRRILTHSLMVDPSRALVSMPLALPLEEQSYSTGDAESYKALTSPSRRLVASVARQLSDITSRSASELSKLAVTKAAVAREDGLQSL